MEFKTTHMYTQICTGEKYTNTFKVYIQQNGKIISPFHDIPTYPSVEEDIINVFNEIPRFENAKFEMSKKEKINPIMQDTKKGQVRFVANIFSSKGYPWNYGAIPQTWENPEIKDEHTGEFGDNDPIDVIEIGTKRKKIGEVYKAKIIGCLALIDDGECDWKIVVVDTEDENAKLLSDIGDVDKIYPGLLRFTFEWFRDYKIPSGSPANRFGFNGEFLSKECAIKVVKNAYEHWKHLMETDAGKDISKLNTTLKYSKHCMHEEFVVVESPISEATVPDFVHEYFFIKK